VNSSPTCLRHVTFPLVAQTASSQRGPLIGSAKSKAVQDVCQSSLRVAGLLRGIL
jgi:hypothetical protein